MYKIGIIGNGFVGNAVATGFSKKFNYDAQVKIYDKNPRKSKHSLVDTINDSDFIFLSVPTPTNASGEIDLSIIDEALDNINKISNCKNIILIRSTTVPGTTENFQKKYPNLRLVFNPEFLTERNAVNDFIDLNRVILGGMLSDTSKVERLYFDRFGKDINVIKTDFNTAELIKYMNNTFLATKISFMNEMKILAEKLNINWDVAVQGFKLDDRVGSSHNDVPGFDGKLGFGGSCLPKDIQALIFFAKKNNVEMNVLEAAWKTNLKIRPQKDWEKLIGRAVSKKT